MFGMYHPRFDRGYNMHAWVEALWNGTMWCFGVVTPGRFMWSGQVWFSLLSCSTALEMLLTFSGLVKKKKKHLQVVSEKPQEDKSIQLLLSKSRPMCFKKLADHLPSNYLMTPKPRQKACQQIVFATLEEKSSCCFHFTQKISLQKEIIGSTSDAHCLVVLIMQFFFLIMAPSIMLYHSCRPPCPNWYLLTEQT